MNVVSHICIIIFMTTVVAIYLFIVVNSTCEALKALHNWTIGSSPDSLLWESGVKLTLPCKLAVF